MAAVAVGVRVVGEIHLEEFQCGRPPLGEHAAPQVTQRRHQRLVALSASEGGEHVLLPEGLRAHNVGLFVEVG